MPVRVYFILSAVVIALTVGIAKWRSLTPPYKIVLLQVFVGLLSESLATYVAFGLHQNNVWIFNIYMLLEIILLGLAGILFLDRPLRRYFQIILLGLIIFWTINAIMNNFQELFNWVFVGSSVFIVTIYTVVLFTKLAFKTKELYTQPLFYISGSFILSFACTIPLFGLINYLIVDNILVADKLFNINVVVIILRYTLIAIAFYLYGSQAKKGYVQQ